MKVKVYATFSVAKTIEVEVPEEIYYAHWEDFVLSESAEMDNFNQDECEVIEKSAEKMVDALVKGAEEFGDELAESVDVEIYDVSLEGVWYDSEDGSEIMLYEA